MKRPFRTHAPTSGFVSRPCALEPLEGRRLLSAALVVGDDAPPPPPPAVRMLGRSVVTAGTGHTFSLVFTAYPGVDRATFSPADVVVTGPNGFEAAPRLVRQVSSTDGRMMIATCRVAAPGGRFDAADNGAYAVSLVPGAVADRLGVTTPGGPVGTFRVAARRAPALAPADIPTRATAGALTAELRAVGAWCDHMPPLWEGRGRQHLLLFTTLTNRSDAPLEVRLDSAHLSFDADQVGTPTEGVSVMDRHGRPTGQKTIVLAPRESREITFRGDNVFPEDRHGQRLYVTLDFTAAGQTARVRNSGVVGVSH